MVQSEGTVGRKCRCAIVTRGCAAARSQLSTVSRWSGILHPTGNRLRLKRLAWTSARAGPTMSRDGVSGMRSGERHGTKLSRSDKKGARGDVWHGTRAAQALKEPAQPDRGPQGRAPRARGRQGSEMCCQVRRLPRDVLRRDALRKLQLVSDRSHSTILAPAATDRPKVYRRVSRCDDYCCERDIQRLRLSPDDPNRLRRKPKSNPTERSTMLATQTGCA